MFIVNYSYFVRVKIFNVSKIKKNYLDNSVDCKSYQVVPKDSRWCPVQGY